MNFTDKERRLALLAFVETDLYRLYLKPYLLKTINRGIPAANTPQDETLKRAWRASTAKELLDDIERNASLGRNYSDEFEVLKKLLKFKNNEH